MGKEKKRKESHVGEQMQAGLAAAEKAQLCPWKAQGVAEGEGRAPSHQVTWDRGRGEFRQTLWGPWGPLSQT